jgi:hypothetical protein
MNFGSVEDRLAIRELVERFTVGIMRLDLDIWIDVWAEEGVWQLPSKEPARGREALRKAFHTTTDYLAFMSMLFFPSGLVVDGDRARGQAYGQEVILPKSGDPAKFLTGCFEDEYVKRDGRWLFLSRNFSVLGIDALRR